jgi:hypothetical protein
VRPMPLKDRVAVAFPEAADDAFSDAFLHMVIERWRDLQVAQRRATTLMVVLVAGFLLLASSKHDAGFDLGPLKLASVAPVLVWAPALISFAGLEVVTLQLGYWRYEAVVKALMERLHPNVSAAELDLAVAPSTVPLWGLPPWERLRTAAPDRLSWIRRRVSALIAALMLAAWMILVTGAYSWLEGRHPDPTAYWVSLAVTALNVARGGMLVVDEGRAGALD